MNFNFNISIKVLFFTIIVWLIITEWIFFIDLSIIKIFGFERDSLVRVFIRTGLYTIIGLFILFLFNYDASAVLGVVE